MKHCFQLIAALLALLLLACTAVAESDSNPDAEYSESAFSSLHNYIDHLADDTEKVRLAALAEQLSAQDMRFMKSLAISEDYGHILFYEPGRITEINGELYFFSEYLSCMAAPFLVLADQVVAVVPDMDTDTYLVLTDAPSLMAWYEAAFAPEDLPLLQGFVSIGDDNGVHLLMIY